MSTTTSAVAADSPARKRAGGARRNKSVASTASINSFSSRMLHSFSNLISSSPSSSKADSDKDVPAAGGVTSWNQRAPHHPTKKSSTTSSSYFEDDNWRRSGSIRPPSVVFTKEEQRKIRMVASPGEHFDENGEIVLAPESPSSNINGGSNSRRLFTAMRPSIAILRRESSSSCSQDPQALLNIMYTRDEASSDAFSYNNPVRNIIHESMTVTTSEGTTTSSSKDQLLEELFGMCIYQANAADAQDDED